MPAAAWRASTPCWPTAGASCSGWSARPARASRRSRWRCCRPCPARAQVVPMDGFHLANVGAAATRPRRPQGRARHLRQRRLRRAAAAPARAARRTRSSTRPSSGARSRSRSPARSRCCRRRSWSSPKATTCCCEDGPWAEVASLLDEIWYVDVDDAPAHRAAGAAPRAVRPQPRGRAGMGGADRRAQCAAHRRHARQGASCDSSGPERERGADRAVQEKPLAPAVCR